MKHYQAKPLASFTHSYAMHMQSNHKNADYMQICNMQQYVYARSADLVKARGVV